MKKTLLSLVFLVGVSSTFGRGSISRILFIYAQPEVYTTVAMPCSLESFGGFSLGVLSKVVTDSVFISKFTPIFRQLRPDPETYSIDARIMAIIAYSDDERCDTLCFGEYHGIDLNGTFMVDNDSLLNLVIGEVWNEPKDSVIYKLPYFKDWTREEIEEFLKVTKL